MTSEATLDLPPAYSATATAEPQQAVTAAQNAATPTADSYTDSSNSPGEGASLGEGASPGEGANPSDPSTKASALMETTSEATGPLNDPTAVIEPAAVGGGHGSSPGESDGINTPSDPTGATETGMAGGGDGGSQGESDGISSPSNPTAAMETQSPQLTTPSGNPTATEGDAPSSVDSNYFSDASSSNSAEGVSATTSSACYNVFPADLYMFIFSCLLSVCLAW
jgi:hypothetical protein